MKTLSTLLLLLTCFYTHAQYCGPVYVRSGAVGAGTGHSWADAFSSLQDAIDAAGPGGQIWVAAGTYFPEKDTSGNAAPAVARAKTFFINKDIQLYGGFAGNEQEIEQRDPAANPTILSGDLGVEGVATDNAYHVLWIALVSPLCVIDGFTITRGNANGFDTGSNQGGGILLQHQPLQYATPVIRNCIIEFNNASSGGGFYTSTDSWAGPSIRIENSKFHGNTASSGGGIYFRQTAVTQTGLELINVEFSDQNVTAYGGGLYAIGRFLAANCRFENNHANRGAGANLEGAAVAVFDSCVFIGNTSLRNGGGLRVEAGTATLNNCLFLGNEANILNESSPTSNAGGGMFYRGSNATFAKLANCVFSGNKGQNGAGFAQTTTLFNTSSAELDNCSFAGNNGSSAVARLQGNLTIENSIVYGNAGTPLTGGTARYCIIEGGYAGTGNLNVDPMFVNIPSYFLAPIATGSLMLQSGSPAIDQGDNAIAPLHITTDAAGNHRMVNCIVDRGAFEFGSPGASDRVCFADTDGDGLGDSATPRLACSTCPPGFVSNNGDCDDGNPDITNSLPAPPALQLSAEFCRGEPDAALRSISAQAPGQLIWVLVQAPPGSRFAGSEPLTFQPGAVNAEFSLGAGTLTMCSAPVYQDSAVNGVWVFEAYYETEAGCRSAARQGFTATVNRGAPQGEIAASADRVCPGDAVILFFHTTGDAGPYDIVVNGQTYTGLTGGAPFDTLVSGIDFADSLVLQLSEISDGLSCQGDTGILQELVLFTAPAVLYVNAAAPPGGNGTAWSRAFAELQDALAAAASCPNGAEIWVAQGTYLPDRGAGDRNASFHLLNNVRLYGGFAGTETVRDERDWTVHPTILSGDTGLSGDSTDNSYTVVTAVDVDSTGLIDGFLIRDGNADGGNPSAFTPLNAGGGMFCNNSDIQVRNCTFQHNAAYVGAGLFIHTSGNPSVNKCSFLDNHARDSGGGLYNAARPRIDSCFFAGNRALFGGGMANQGSNGQPDVLYSEFIQNTAGYGGGLHNDYLGTPEFSHCSFMRNIATTAGGGVSNFGNQARFTECNYEENTCIGNGGGFSGSPNSSAQLISCTFTGNTSGEKGGGVYANQDLVLQNCLLSGNRASAGGGIYYNISQGLNARLNHCTFGGNFAEDRGGAIAVDIAAGISNFSAILENSIVWGNSANGPGRQIWSSGNGVLAIFSTCYADSPGDIAGQGAFSADAGSITANPQFLSPLPASSAPTAGGNYRLGPCSPAVDAGDPGLIPAGITSDLDGSPRIVGASVDMGAYETSAAQSMLTVTPAITPPSCFGTADGSATVNAEGGAPPYQYLWSSGQTSATATMLAPGVYTVSVSDAAGCTGEIIVTIPVTPLLESQVTGVQHPLCNSSPTGAASLEVTGGTPPYTYMWNTGQTGATAAGLAPGEYSVTATDANGCSTVQHVMLEPQYYMVSAIMTVQNLACHGDSTAEVSISAMGGVEPYQYQWAHGPQTANISGLPAGVYHFSITDANGCTATGAAMFADPPLLELSTGSQAAACLQAADGTATAGASGGTAPYTYQWSNGQSGTAIIGLPAGVYGVTATDHLGCTASAEVVVTAQVFAPDSEIELDGNMLTVAETGASYQWIDCDTGLPVAGATEQTFTPAQSGVYAVVLGSGACRDTSHCVTVVIVSSAEVVEHAEPASAFPNPNDGWFTLRLPGPAEVMLYDATGKAIFLAQYAAGEHRLRLDGPPGVYLLWLRRAEARQAIRLVKQ